jgi:hypothetical protein
LTVEDHVALLENQVHELFDILEQLAKDLELAEANLHRSLKGVRPERTAVNHAEQISQGTQAIAVNEVNFTCLKWDLQHSDKMGDYDIAGAANNVPDKFNQAYKILEASNATIKARYHGQTYVYSYWIYGEGKIYRQLLKPKETPKP